MKTMKIVLVGVITMLGASLGAAELTQEIELKNNSGFTFGEFFGTKNKLESITSRSYTIIAFEKANFFVQGRPPLFFMYDQNDANGKRMVGRAEIFGVIIKPENNNHADLTQFLSQRTIDSEIRESQLQKVLQARKDSNKPYGLIIVRNFGGEKKSVEMIDFDLDPAKKPCFALAVDREEVRSPDGASLLGYLLMVNIKRC